MFHRSSPGSVERQKFLEKAQTQLADNLETGSVAKSLGTKAVQRLRVASSRLVIPNIRDGRAVLPREYRDTDSVPYVALRYGESIGFSRTDRLPSPAQRIALWGLIQAWIGEENVSISETENFLIHRMERKIPASVDLEIKPKDLKGFVHSKMTGFYGSETGLKKAPERFYIKGRPIVGLAYAGGYRTDTVLTHELVHLEQALDEPAIINMNDDEITGTLSCHHELEAYHYGARYISSVPRRNLLVGLWQDTDFMSQRALQIEGLREQFADPEHPFEPNDALISAIGKLGINLTANE